MLDKQIKDRIDEINEKSNVSELQDKDWLFFQDIYSRSDNLFRNQLVQILSNHTGVKQEKITSAFDLLSDIDASINAKNEALLLLQAFQQTETQKIINLHNKYIIKQSNLKPLNITRNEWLLINSKIELNERKRISSIFIVHSLSTIRKVSYDLLSEQISKKQPRREVKKLDIPREKHATKRVFSFFKNDDQPNPLILESNENNAHLEEQMKDVGARYETLADATPERSYTTIKRTPNGSKARQLCTIGPNSLFQHLSPYSKDCSKEGRLDLRQSSSKKVSRSLFAKPDPIEFTATLESIQERSGKLRKISQKSLMGISSSDVFRSYGIIISAKEGHYYHWAHLIAFFLGGPQDSINLIPSTAAANYNTLEAIELFIKEKLVNEETEEIKIKVEPRYTKDLLIPELLVYSLHWITVNDDGLQKINEETFYINPQSYQRINQSMHKTINTLRDNEEMIKSMLV